MMHENRESEGPKVEAAPLQIRKRFRNVALNVLAGVVVPLVLLQIDPFFFGGQDGDSLVGSASSGMYILIFLSMTAFLLHLLRATRVSFLSVLLSGGIFAGSLVSGLLGLLMLPLSMLGVRIYGIGLLGFYPFAVCMLYFRSACAALHWRSRNAKWRVIGCFVLGFTLVIGIPILVVTAANFEIDRLIAVAQTGSDFRSVDWRKEHYRTWAGDKDRIVRVYRTEIQMKHQAEALDNLCFQLTGRTAEKRMLSISQSD